MTFAYTGALLGSYATFQWDAVVLFTITTAITLGAGYSVGLHRCLIHNSFQCSPWLESTLVYLGVLAGIDGPYSLIESHDLRDWAQRQPRCHDYFTSRQNLLVDWVWQIHCDIELHYPPIFRYESRLVSHRFYQWLEQTWMLQQFPWALLFYYFGGWSWVFWGIYLRIAVCVTSRWLIHYCASRWGDRPYWTEAAAVQHHNLPFLGLLSLGESWQNNHQAFPNSARFGICYGQADPGWWFIQSLGKLGFAWDIQHPQASLPSRGTLPIPTIASSQPDREPRRKVI